MDEIINKKLNILKNVYLSFGHQSKGDHDLTLIEWMNEWMNE